MHGANLGRGEKSLLSASLLYLSLRNCAPNAAHPDHGSGHRDIWPFIANSAASRLTLSVRECRYATRGLPDNFLPKGLRFARRILQAHAVRRHGGEGEEPRPWGSVSVCLKCPPRLSHRKHGTSGGCPLYFCGARSQITVPIHASALDRCWA